MSELRVLFICHNHPSLHPGGTEIFAHNLFGEMKRSQRVTALFLACTNAVHRSRKPGTSFQTVGRSADELLLWTGHFDRFFQSQIDLHGVVPELSNLLLSFRPDVVHVHHTLLLGVEMLFLVRRLLPRTKIVFTLHDYYAICANEGQMVTTQGQALCRAASPDACHRCFPEIAPDRFVLRTKHLQAMFSTVDLFIAPSAFLRARYESWGLAADRIAVIGNGQPDRPPAEHRPLPDRGRRDTFGYFGNISPFKGAPVAVEAARRLALSGDRGFSLQVHGGMPFQTPEFRESFAEAVASAGPCVSHHGAYEADQVSDLMRAVDWVVVPSIWWENAPLVIQEAFQNRRPVLCSGIGGMAEMVRDGVDGLHFRVADPASLMRAMRRAIDEPGLWERLVAGIPEVPTMAACAAAHRAAYDGLLRSPVAATRQGASGPAVAAASPAGAEGTYGRIGVEPS